MYVVEVNNLFKTYREVKGFVFRKVVREVPALKGVTFRIKEGEIFGYLGPNAAGKTTTARILSTYLTFDSGEVKICGYSLRDRKKLGKVRRLVAAQYWGHVHMYAPLTVRENLRVIARLRHLPPSVEDEAVEAAIDAVGLRRYADVPAYLLSAGFRGRLNVAACLVSRPKLIILDEPTAFIDVVAAEELLKYIRKISREMGVTVFYTTHRLYEAERICDRVAIIHEGRIFRVDTVENVRRLFSHYNRIYVQVPRRDLDAAVRVLSEHFGGDRVETYSSPDFTLKIIVDGGSGSLARVVAVLEKSGIRVQAAGRFIPSLEEVMIDLFGNNSGGGDGGA